MEIIETAIDIAAPPQTAWSVLDNLIRYPEWNPIIPALQGRTVLGGIVEGELIIPGMPPVPLSPTITRVVGAREFRWLSVVPGDQGFSAEHIFQFHATATGTHMIHREIFDGPASVPMAGAIQNVIKPAYENFNIVFKARVEAFAAAAVALHPSVDGGQVKPQPGNGTPRLLCRCPEDAVEVTLGDTIHHNHLCGCSKCWKPEGALFAQTAVVAAGSAEVTAHADKLAVVDNAPVIRRHACTVCGTHMLGRVEDKAHHFYGIDFIHPELLAGGDAEAPEFAGFVSSIIETGTNASLMHAVRARLAALEIPAYDAFSPELMDIIAYHKVKMSA